MIDAVYRVVDLETTGETPPEHAIIEIASLDIVGDRLAEGRDFLVNPMRDIPPDASMVHGLIDADVADAPEMDDVVEAALHSNGSPDFFVAHQAKFELQWLKPYSHDVPWICTYKCAMRAWPEAPRFKLQFLRYWLHLALPSGGAHRAPADCLTTAHVFGMLRQVATIDDLVSWSAEPPLMPRIPFGMHRGKLWSQPPDDYFDWMLAEAKMDEDLKWNARREIARRAEAQLEAATEAPLEAATEAAERAISSIWSLQELEDWFREAKVSLRLERDTPRYQRIVAACARQKAVTFSTAKPPEGT